MDGRKKYNDKTLIIFIRGMFGLESLRVQGEGIKNVMQTINCCTFIFISMEAVQYLVHLGILMSNCDQLL